MNHKRTTPKKQKVGYHCSVHLCILPWIQVQKCSYQTIKIHLLTAQQAFRSTSTSCLTQFVSWEKTWVHSPLSFQMVNAKKFLLHIYDKLPIVVDFSFLFFLAIFILAIGVTLTRDNELHGPIDNAFKKCRQYHDHTLFDTFLLCLHIFNFQYTVSAPQLAMPKGRCVGSPSNPFAAFSPMVFTHLQLLGLFCNYSHCIDSQQQWSESAQSKILPPLPQKKTKKKTGSIAVEWSPTSRMKVNKEFRCGPIVLPSQSNNSVRTSIPSRAFSSSCSNKRVIAPMHSGIIPWK